MNKRQSSVSAVAAIAIVLVFLFPPYFGIDRTSEGRVHGTVGFHPAWAPPGPEHVLAVFAEDGLIPEEGVEATALDIRVNKVGMVFEVAGVVVLMPVAWFALRTRKRTEEEE